MVAYSAFSQWCSIGCEKRNYFDEYICERFSTRFFLVQLDCNRLHKTVPLYSAKIFYEHTHVASLFLLDAVQYEKHYNVLNSILKYIHIKCLITSYCDFQLVSFKFLASVNCTINNRSRGSVHFPKNGYNCCIAEKHP